GNVGRLDRNEGRAGRRLLHYRRRLRLRLGLCRRRLLFLWLAVLLMLLVLSRRRAARQHLRSEPGPKQCRAAQEITSVQVHLSPPPFCIESNAEISATRKLLIAPPGGDGFAH